MRSPLGRRYIISAIEYWDDITSTPEELVRFKDLRDLVNRDMATRLMIRAKREALCRR
jgi:hypothetical protein